MAAAQHRAVPSAEAARSEAVAVPSAVTLVAARSEAAAVPSAADTQEADSPAAAAVAEAAEASAEDANSSTRTSPFSMRRTSFIC